MLVEGMQKILAQEITPKIQERKPKKELSKSHSRRKEIGKVLIAGHFDPEVRSALFLIQAKKSHVGRSLQDMLGEAINDYCAKYHVPQPYKPTTQ
jgi:hypothetical protein